MSAAAVALTSCAGGTTTTPTTTSAPAPATTTASVPAVSEEQAQSLCTDLQAQLSNWRLQGPTVGRGGLNILVQTWAARYGLNAAVIGNRSIVDTATVDACADVRTEALDALDIPDLASGLVGL